MMEHLKLPFLFLVFASFSTATIAISGDIKSSTFLSPLMELTPGLVSNKYYLNIDFPRGHIAVKDFFAEVVDEDGNPVPLYEAYLHHWIVIKEFHRQGNNNTDDFILGDIDGLCQSGTLQQYWGLGSDTRRTLTYLPDPYAVEVGNPNKIPDGYLETWTMNAHAIDTRGVDSRLGCLECRCDLYNKTVDTIGEPLPRGYAGGLQCCGDGYQCKLKKSSKETKRGLYVRYTVKWADWSESFLPVRIFIFDVTDTGIRSADDPNVGCNVEYQVDPCDHRRKKGEKCVYEKRASRVMTRGGYFVYGVGHQHIGGRGIALYKEDGSVICDSKPIYGNGREAGNESGYVVGMESCQPKAGTIKIKDGEKISLVSKYSNKKLHAGVMGLFHFLLAE